MVSSCRRDVTDLDDDARYHRRKFFYPSFRLLRNIFSVPTPPPRDPYAAWSANSRHRASPISARARALSSSGSTLSLLTFRTNGPRRRQTFAYFYYASFSVVVCLRGPPPALCVSTDFTAYNIIIVPHGNNNIIIIPVVVARCIIIIYTKLVVISDYNNKIIILWHCIRPYVIA